MKITNFVFVCILIIGIFIFSTANAEIVRILTPEEAPTNYTLNGKIVGTTVDIVEEMLKYMNSDLKIEMVPWARAYKHAKTKPNIAVFTCGRTQERIDLGFHFIGPVVSRKHVLWKKKGSPIVVNSFEDMKNQNLTVGGVRQDWRGKYVRDNGVRLDVTNSHEANAKKLFLGRIDLWALSDIEAGPVMKRAGLDINEIELAFVLKKASSFIMLSKETPNDVVEKWQAAFKAIQKTDFGVKASQKWGNILGLTLEFTSDKGFIIN